MKRDIPFSKVLLFFITLLLAGIHQAAAQGTRFFRISGPAATTITAFNADGTLVWSNTMVGTNYTVQTVSSLPGGTNWVDYVQLPVTSSVNTNLIFSFNPPAGMVLIPGGAFTMGNSIGDSDILDAIPTNVMVSAFYMDVNPVSYSQWQAVYAYATNHGYNFVNAGLGKAANQPVQAVDWFDCVKWCNARSQSEGLAPVYFTDAGLTQVFTNGDDAPETAVYANWSANGYRLPTEAEWEKAARGGLSGQRFPWGDTISESQANYYSTNFFIYGLGSTNFFIYDLGPNGYNTNFDTGGYPYTSPAGSFAPNGYGLNDMAGNVMEWCWDWYAPPAYPVGSPYLGGTDPHGPVLTPGPGSLRVWRGGGWIHNAGILRCASREAVDPSRAVLSSGFRCVLGP
jgi:formylglycine-generating enzyme required for sulfatase activity